MKFFDIVFILLVAGLTFFAAYSVYMKPQEKSQVLIRGLNNEWIFPVEADETIVVSGPIGNTIVRLHNKKAWIESSPCDNQTCVAHGNIERQGQWTACLPNNVLLMIHGTEDEGLDGIVW